MKNLEHKIKKILPKILFLHLQKAENKTYLINIIIFFNTKSLSIRTYLYKKNLCLEVSSLFNFTKLTIFLAMTMRNYLNN